MSEEKKTGAAGSTAAASSSQAPAPHPAPAPSAATSDPSAKSKPDKSGAQKKPGRPIGAKTKPKADAGELPRVRRVSGDEVKDTRAYLLGLQEDAEKASKRHNEQHPNDPFEVVVRRGGAGPQPQMSPEECEALAAMGVDFLGKLWRVDARPPREGLKLWAQSASQASAYLPMVPPMYMAFFGLALNTLMLLAPMLEERNERLGHVAKVEGVAVVKEPGK